MLKNSLLTIAASVCCLVVSTGASMAMTAQECKDAGGTYKQIIGNKGICTFSVEKMKIDIVGDIRNISAEKCKELGGQLSDDGKNCIVNTVGRALKKDPSQSN